ncbi:MAG TPA: type II secretion system protein GspG [Myxococcota bacterium]|nr:type II secretion system protein GspG [Myxococcota bacterium]HOA12509.1 type II secretion system protein GspG [Myxococcota bacterium]HOC99258.1 type II secretion system protein GspG [Myxococcota bacterium]HOH75814.1 type II secretion system protein GspG [Myxococcota bacterium]HPV03433.1 type II secretion system protein GspG [Myxococcota bacterium]
MNARSLLMHRVCRVTAARGMTLIEIMVVIAIIGIVMTAVGVGVVPQLNKARIKAAAAQLNTIENALTTYSLDADTPNSLEELTKGGGALLKAKQLKDPWGTLFTYAYPSSDSDREYDLCSNGPDKRAGTDDDICNYEK